MCLCLCVFLSKLLLLEEVLAQSDWDNLIIFDIDLIMLQLVLNDLLSSTLQVPILCWTIWNSRVIEKETWVLHDVLVPVHFQGV